MDRVSSSKAHPPDPILEVETEWSLISKLAVVFIHVDARDRSFIVQVFHRTFVEATGSMLPVFVIF
jgi:hypothetical protein